MTWFSIMIIGVAFSIALSDWARVFALKKQCTCKGKKKCN